MSQDRLFYLLANLKSNQQEQNVTYPSLHPNVVATIGKNLAELICSDEKSTNRTAYIRFLKQYCRKSPGHLSIDDGNYEAFLNLSPFNQTVIQTESNETEDTSLQEALNFYNNEIVKHTKRSERLDHINERNNKSFDNFIYTPSKQLQNFTENKEFVESIVNSTKNHEIQETKQDQQIINKIEKRQKNIKFAYAVLNLNATNKNRIIINIFDELKANLPLKEFEMEFLEFVCNNSDDFKEEIVTKFPHIIEKPLIRLCTNLLVEEMSDVELDKRLELVLKCINANASLRYSSLLIVYNLFALSNYNEKLLRLIVKLE